MISLQRFWSPDLYLTEAVIQRNLLQAEAFTERQGYGSVVKSPQQIKEETAVIISDRERRAEAMR